MVEGMIYSDETVRLFRSSIHTQHEVSRAQLHERYLRARSYASRIARLLCEKYGAQKACLTGSLLDPDNFTLRSDIDIVVFGMPASSFFSAVAECMNEEFDIDIVPFENANDFMKSRLLEHCETLYEKQNP